MQSGPLGYLDVSGVEVANSARTLSYLRRGLGNTLQGHWELGSGDVCSVLYRLGGVPVTYVSPVADPAPWYNPDEPGSTTFLGVVLLRLKGYDSKHIYRTVATKTQGLGGATFSAQHRKERVWNFRAGLISSDDAGAEYGGRWLRQALAQPACDDCDTGTITVRLVCPPSDGSDDTLGEWTAYDTVLSSGVDEVEQWSPQGQGADTDVLGGCRDFIIVEWEMVSGNPFLYKPAQATGTSDVFIGDTAEGCGAIYGSPGAFYFGAVDLGSDDFESGFGTPGVAVCTSVDAPLQGTVAPVFTLRSVSGMGEVLLEGRASCADTASDPALQMLLKSIPEASTVEVNCATRKVTVTQSGVSFDGGYLLDIPDGRSSIEWVECRDCDTGIGCFCARTANDCSGGIDTSVGIATQYRDG